MHRILLLCTVFSMCPAGWPSARASELLIEAESFVDKGGWVVDQQFVEQMGSPFLLAHGLGRPVIPAVSRVQVPKADTYRLWVRTRNWVPGDWEAPGRFRVRVNGKVLPAEFGAEGAAWHWQDGGDVKLPAGETELALLDLTGFDGRCDALLLTTSSEPPPEDPGTLRSWRRTLSGMPVVPASAKTYDVVVVGGGIAGCAAALAASEQGLRTALIHDRPVLGGNASGEIRVHTLGITGHGGALLDRLNTRHWPNGSAEALTDDAKRHRTMTTAPGVDLFLSWRAYDAPTEGNRITAVHARHIENGEALRFEAPVFIDTTGDGWIGFWAGADYRYGRESRYEFDEGWEKHGDLWSPEEADQRVLGTSLLWYAEPAEATRPFPAVPWAMDVARDSAAVKGEWHWEFSRNDLHTIDDGEAIRDHMLRAIYGSFANANKQAKYAGYALSFVGYVGGKRESRRLMGDYIYTLQDGVEGRTFPDAVVTERRDFDGHHQLQYQQSSYPYDFRSKALFMKVPEYYLPFRALYSRNIENLMMAGRCFSCSHVGLSGPRVMNTCGQMGIATGYAASLCVKHDTTPRGVYREYLDELLALVKGDSAVHGHP